jgi:tetratricopeptide (TPR) repeat protein
MAAPKHRFERTQTVIAADQARTKGKRKKAIALYREVLEHHPDDLGVQGKLAALLAAQGDRAGAVARFRSAAEGHLKAGFTDRALSVLAQATEAFADEEPLWVQLAELQEKRGRRADAVAALAEGGERLLASGDPHTAARILQRAGQLSPWHFETTLLLARALAGTGNRRDAARLLDGLATRRHGPQRRAARALAVRLAPTPRQLWRWLRAALER